jgi:hypothetical protein
MTSYSSCVKGETNCRVNPGETEERVAKIAGTQDACIVLHNVGNIHEYLLGSQTRFMESDCADGSQDTCGRDEGGSQIRGSVETWLTIAREEQTSSKPRRSQRAFHEKDLKKAYSSFEAFLNLVKSSPKTMTTSGHSRFASVISWSL